MARRRKNKEELTTEMHAEFSVSEETDRKHITWTALNAMESGLMNKLQAMEAYGVTQADMDRHRNEWEANA